MGKPIFRYAAALAVLVCLLGDLATVRAQEGESMSILDEIKIDDAVLAQLIGTGQVLIVREKDNGRLRLITSGIIIDQPVQKVWDVITDYRHYSDFMPSTEVCEVVADNGNVKDVRYKIKFGFVISFSLDYVLHTTLTPPDKVKWTLVPGKGGKLKESFGSWQLIPIDGGKRTAAFYSVYSDISDVVWGLDRLMKKDPGMEVAINASTCVLVLKAVKNRSENPSWTRKK